MKALILLLFPIMIIAQVPNFSFENWSNGEPDEWTTTNIAGTVTNITQVSDAHSGTWALKGEISTLFNVPYGPSVSTREGFTAGYFPINQKYATVDGWYKLDRNGGMDEALSVLAFFLDENNGVCGQAQALLSPEDSYTKFSIPVDYSFGTGNTPVKASIQVAIGSDGTFTLGAYFIVDDITFEGVASAIDEDDAALQPLSLNLKPNYPNPFNPTTTFDFQIAVNSNVSLKIYDLSGKEIAVPLNKHLNAGSYSVKWDAKNFSSGVYIYRFKADEYVKYGRMVLMK
ncbi:MAG: T9SS type A sorting domain-containing protein [Calditrichae bacterium]|nr:T9SS type A sorting domain-containing protein [Calditrichota bacterium]MCB9056938.1 T9SS type A sorting domain-containing protein [Calditrichia bacterium]